MPKRIATSELNHDNWNDEEAPEEAGTFQKASADIIEKRVIKRSRRRCVGSPGSGPSVFAGFQGFSKTPDNNTSSLFSFLKKGNADNAGQEKVDGGELKSSAGHTIMFKELPKEVPISEQSPSLPSPPFTVAYLGAIKKLNECFLKHLQTCFDDNQYIILSPCFRDYEQHLKNILPLNSSASKGEGESKASEENVTNLLQKQEREDEPSSKSDSGKKINFSANINKEINTKPGFKIFGGEGNATLPNASANTLGATSIFANPAGKKQFPWMGGWGATSQTPVSEPAKESSKGESTGAGEEDESEAPPKAEFKQVVEEGAVYSRRCKVFVKKDNNYHDHGVGMLYLKPVESGKKTQLIVRADTSLGNLLLNTLLNADMTLQKMGNNNVMLVCLPTPDFKPPKPLPVLLRVKTSDDADELLQKLNEFKK